MSMRELYQEVIIDHGVHPRNHREISDANHRKEGFNPLCGDKLELFIKEQNGVIEDLSFTGCGCAISMASASLMTECLKGKRVDEALALFEGFHRMVTEDIDGESLDLGKLAVLGGVNAYPARVKCASLAWHTLKAAVENNDEPVSTE